MPEALSRSQHLQAFDLPRQAAENCFLSILTIPHLDPVARTTTSVHGIWALVPSFFSFCRNPTNLTKTACF